MQNQTYPTEWTLGKPRGSIKGQPTGYVVVMSPPKAKQINKFFTTKTYKDKPECLVKAKEWQLQESNRLGLTRNRIRYNKIINCYSN